MTTDDLVLVSADNEWSPLKAIIVGRADHSAFPAEPPHVIEAIMPKGHWDQFQPQNPFPSELVKKAQGELDNFSNVLEQHGVRVYRPREVDWVKAHGYTGSMARDALMSVGDTIIESAFAFQSRRNEVQLAYVDILDELSSRGSATIHRAPIITGRDTIYDDRPLSGINGHGSGITDQSAINNTRVAFDTADFMRFGKTIIGQLSHVTNEKGVEYVREKVPKGYSVELLETKERTGKMHIDTTILPLRHGLLVYCPDWVTEESLRRHEVFRDWELHAYPFTPKNDPSGPPAYTCSAWLVLNALSLDERRIFVEEKNTQFAEWVREKFNMEPIMLPFQHVNSIGGSFHCATVDLVRSS